MQFQNGHLMKLFFIVQMIFKWKFLATFESFLISSANDKQNQHERWDSDAIAKWYTMHHKTGDIVSFQNEGIPIVESLIQKMSSNSIVLDCVTEEIYVNHNSNNDGTSTGFGLMKRLKNGGK